MKLAVMNGEEQQDSTSRQMAESMIDAGEQRIARKKRNGRNSVQVDLKELRGTAHMPKFEDFAPRWSEVIPLSPHRSHRNSPNKSHELKQTIDQKGFRRHKYFKSEMKVEDL